MVDNQICKKRMSEFGKDPNTSCHQLSRAGQQRKSKEHIHIHCVTRIDLLPNYI